MDQDNFAQNKSKKDIDKDNINYEFLNEEFGGVDISGTYENNFAHPYILLILQMRRN